MDAKPSTSLHIAMFPWFAFGHIKIFLHLSNKLAEKRHKISFLAPTKTIPKLEPLNFYPNLITFVPITVPDVEGLPSGTETTMDLPFPMLTLLATALDRTEETIKNLLGQLRVDMVFFDMPHWLPQVAKELAIKSVYFDVIGPAPIGFVLSPERTDFTSLTSLMKAPKNYPDQSIKLQTHEARDLAKKSVMQFGNNIQFFERLIKCMSQADMIIFKGCREIEGAFCDYLEAQFGRPIVLTGPFLPEPPTSPLEEKWDSWLSKFNVGSVVYCAFGSECILSKGQFQELVLGLELTGFPFLAALKPPVGFKSVEAALPENFEERTKERGIVHGGWVQQQLILGHPSVGCFITHCGSNSLSEAFLAKCQLVLLPEKNDQVLNARMMGGKLKVGVEVRKGDEDGLFTKEAVSQAVRLVMDESSEVGLECKANRTKIREILVQKDLESSYIDNFIKNLTELI